MTDFSDPGYLRHCMLPGCEARFNIVTGEGLRDVPGWRLLKAVASGYLCPSHSPLLTKAGHMPHWLTTGELPEPGLRGIGCACGWQWQPAVPTNAGGHHERWHAHLAELSADTTPDPAETETGMTTTASDNGD